MNQNTKFVEINYMNELVKYPVNLISISQCDKSYSYISSNIDILVKKILTKAGVDLDQIDSTLFDNVNRHDHIIAVEMKDCGSEATLIIDKEFVDRLENSIREFQLLTETILLENLHVEKNARTKALVRALNLFAEDIKTKCPDLTGGKMITKDSLNLFEQFLSIHKEERQTLLSLLFSFETEIDSENNYWKRCDEMMENHAMQYG